MKPDRAHQLQHTIAQKNSRAATSATPTGQQLKEDNRAENHHNKRGIAMSHAARDAPVVLDRNSVMSRLMRTVRSGKKVGFHTSGRA
jgi:hypothetical protein